MLRKGSVWFSLILIAIVLFFIIESFNYSAKARLVPLIVAIPTLVMLVLILLSDKYPRLISLFDDAVVQKTGAVTEAPAAAAEKKGVLSGTLGMAIWIAFLFLLILLVGFYIASPIFIFLYLKFRQVGWVRSLAFALIAGAVIYAAFDIVMKGDMFEGILFGGRTKPL